MLVKRQARWVITGPGMVGSWHFEAAVKSLWGRDVDLNPGPTWGQVAITLLPRPLFAEEVRWS